MTFPPPFSQVLPAMAALDTKRRCSLRLSRSTPMSLEEILSYLHPPCRNNSRCQGFAALVEAAQLRVPISKKEGTVVAVWPEGVYTDDSFELILFTLIQKYYYCPTKYPKAQNRNALSPKSFRETY